MQLYPLLNWVLYAGLALHKLMDGRTYEWMDGLNNKLRRRQKDKVKGCHDKSMHVHIVVMHMHTHLQALRLTMIAGGTHSRIGRQMLTHDWKTQLMGHSLYSQWSVPFELIQQLTLRQGACQQFSIFCYGSISQAKPILTRHPDQKNCAHLLFNRRTCKTCTMTGDAIPRSSMCWFLYEV